MTLTNALRKISQKTSINLVLSITIATKKATFELNIPILEPNILIPKDNIKPKI